MPKKRTLKKGVYVLFVAIIFVAVAVIVITKPYWNRKAKVSSSSAKASSSSSGTASLSSAQNAETKAGGLLMLANKDNVLPESYVPTFAKVPASYYISSAKDTRFDERAAPYLEKFIDAARAAGYNVDIISGYRTYQYQQDNYTRHVKQLEAKGETASQAQADAANLVAPPGTSEHETGLAADIVTSDWYKKNPDLTSDFDKTPAFAWMYSHCADYGFILRYPKDKVSVTKYEYEPWHYRFVGIQNAKIIMQKKICLEEFVSGK